MSVQHQSEDSSLRPPLSSPTHPARLAHPCLRWRKREGAWSEAGEAPPLAGGCGPPGRGVGEQGWACSCPACGSFVSAPAAFQFAEPVLTMALAVSSDQLVIPILQTGNCGSGGGSQPRFLGQEGTQADLPDLEYCPLHAVGRASFREGAYKEKLLLRPSRHSVRRERA